MATEPAPLTVQDWDDVPASETPGDHGVMLSRVAEAAGRKLRVVELSPGYLANHWCEKGHAAYVLYGELTLERQGGERVVLRRGQGFAVGDGPPAHRARAGRKGARLFLVD